MQRDNQTGKTWAWAVCGVLLLATLLNYMDRQALSVTAPTLKNQFNLHEERLGMLEGWFGYSFAFGSIFFGWLADRFGPRYLYPALLAGWSLAGIATSLAAEPWVAAALQQPDDPPGTAMYRWMLGCRIALGVCEAGHWPCALLTVRAILDSKDRTLGNGILQSGASIGAIIVPLYIEASDRAGNSWSFPFWSIGLAGLLWVPVWFLLVSRRELSRPKEGEKEALRETEAIRDKGQAIREEGQGVGDEGQAKGDVPEVRPSRVAAAATIHQLRRLVVLGVIVATITISWQFLRAWLALFLEDHRGFKKDATRWIIAGYFIVADIGCLLAGVLVAKLAARGWRIHSARQAGFITFTLLTACGALVPFVGQGWLMIALLFTAAAGILGLHPYYYALTQEISVKRMGLLSGGLACFGWLVASRFQIFVGGHIKATKSYELGFLIAGFVPLLGLAALLALWPAKPAQADGIKN